MGGTAVLSSSPDFISCVISSIEMTTVLSSSPNFISCIFPILKQEYGGVSNRLRFDSVRGERQFPPPHSSFQYKFSICEFLFKKKLGSIKFFVRIIDDCSVNWNGL